MDLGEPKLRQIPQEDRDIFQVFPYLFGPRFEARLARIVFKTSRTSKTTNLPWENTFTWVSGAGFMGQEHASEAQEYLIC